MYHTASPPESPGVAKPPAKPTPFVPVSWGELLDKISILEIKRARLPDPAARANVARELAALAAIGADAVADERVGVLFAALKEVNEALWDIEEAIRREEARGRFGDAFVQLARAVYQRNDRRAAIKRTINDLLGSELVEEKSYWTAPAMPVEVAIAVAVEA